MHVLELSNVETGAFRVRLVRAGEGYGLHHQLVWDDEPGIEFYGPAVDGEPLSTADFLERYEASQFRRPRSDWLSLGPGLACHVSPENSAAIADWLERELARPWTPPPPRPRPPSQRRVHRPAELHDAGNRRVTLYLGGLFGYKQIEAEWAHVERRQHAVRVRLLPRRKRAPRVMVLTGDPDLVIVLGWGHPDLQQATVTTRDTTSLGRQVIATTLHATRYTGGDPRYEQDFERALDDYLESLPLAQLLVDLRGERITRSQAAPVDARLFHPSATLEVGAARLAATTSVFVSYHHGGDAAARERFERGNGPVIRSASIYPGELGTGPEVRRGIRRRILGCDSVVVLVGRDTHTRRWVDWEIRAALTRDANGAPKPVVGILLPEMADLGEALATRWEVRPGESSSALIGRSDAVSRELLDAVGTTVPARLLDNLLSGYATLVEWPASPGALLEALDAAAGDRGRPVNSRRLRAKNIPLAADAPAPEHDELPSTPQERTTPETDSTPDDPDEAFSPGSVPPVSPPDGVTGGDLVAWTVGAVHEHGPEAVLAGLDAGPEHVRLASALRRHADLLAPLDSVASLAATLLGRLTPDDPLAGHTADIAAVARGPHLALAAPAPDLPPAELTCVLRNGDTGVVAMVADSRQGWLAAADRSGVVTVWDTTTWTISHVLGRATTENSVRALVADPRGGWFARGGSRGTVEVWDPATGGRLHTFACVFGEVEAMAVDPRGRWLAAADTLGIAQLWSVSSGAELVRTPFGADTPRAMAVSPDGTWLAVAGHRVFVFDTGTGERIHELAPPRGGCASLVVDANGDWLGCANEYGATVRMWPMPAGGPPRDVTRRSRSACVGLDPAGRWVATVGDKGVVHLWPLTPGEKRRKLVGRPNDPVAGVVALTVAPDGSWLTAATDRGIRVWDTTTGEQRHALTGHAGRVNVLLTAHDGRWLASGGEDGQIRLWDTATPRATARPATRSAEVTALVTAPDSSWHAVAHRGENTITICAPDTGWHMKIEPEPESDHDLAVEALQAAPDGRWLASAHSDGTIHVWEPHDGSPRHRLVGRFHPRDREVATQLATAPDGTWLASWGHSSRIRIWSTLTGELVTTVTAPRDSTWVAVEPGGAWLASAGGTGRILLWRVTESHPFRILTGHHGPVHALAVVPSSGHLVSCGEDTTVRLWDPDHGARRSLTVPAAASLLTTCPRGEWFAAAGGDAAIRVWAPDRDDEPFVLTGHRTAPSAMASDRHGRHLASVDSHGEIHVWDPTTGSSVAALRVGGPLTAVRWGGDELVVGGVHGVYRLVLDGGDHA